MRTFVFKTGICLLIVMLVACDPRRVYEKNTAITGDAWRADDVLKFETTITDTISLHDVYVNVRNADGYPYSNLYIFVNTLFPNGKKYRDTLELILADDKGRPLGDGIGDLYDHQILYRKNVRFPVKGVYRWEYEQAMRVKELPLIVDMGLRVEKQKQ